MFWVVFWGVRTMVWPSVSITAFCAEIVALRSFMSALRPSNSFRWCEGSIDRMYVFHCSICSSKRLLLWPLMCRTYSTIASRDPRPGRCSSRQARKSLSVAGMLPIPMILKGKGLIETVLLLSSVADFTIPLVSSVRIGLASRVLLVQANT